MTETYPLPPPFSDDEVLQPLRPRSLQQTTVGVRSPSRGRLRAAVAGAVLLAAAGAAGSIAWLGGSGPSREGIAALVDATALPAAPAAKPAGDKPAGDRPATGGPAAASGRAAPTAERAVPTPTAPTPPPTPAAPIPAAPTAAAPLAAAAPPVVVAPPPAIAPPATFPPMAPVREQARTPLAPSRPEPARRLASEEIRTHLERGEALLAQGDLTAARLFFERVAEAGDARGAAGLARSYDPDALSRLPVHGVGGDPAQAERWRRIAASMAPAFAERR